MREIPYPAALVGGLIVGIVTGFVAAVLGLTFLALRGAWRSIMADPQFKVIWVDGHTEPTVAPNPEYPNGIDVIGANPEEPFCQASLPYPARRCGYYRVECRNCGVRVMVTTAGRPDDPRSLTVNCSLRPGKTDA